MELIRENAAAINLSTTMETNTTEPDFWIDPYLSGPPTTDDLVIATIACLLLAASFISSITLAYITIHHGYGSQAIDILVFNWTMFTTIYSITHSALNNIHQFALHNLWPFGLPACIVTQFLENFCLLPMDIIPAVLCVLIFHKVFHNDMGILSWMKQVPLIIWVTLGIWVVVIDCILGSFYRGELSSIRKGKPGDEPSPMYCLLGYTSSSYEHLHTIYILECVFEMIVGILVPSVAVIIVGVLTVRRTKATGGQVISPLSHKLKVRQLILALMGIMVIHYFFFFIGYVMELVFSGMIVARSSTLMTTAVTLALVFCHVEFWRSLTNRRGNAEDEATILPPVNTESPQEPEGTP